MTSVKMGSRGSVPDGVGDAVGSPGGVGDATGTPVVGVAGCERIGGTVVVPGGVCGAGRCVPGAAVGLVGRVCSGWPWPCPGGRVASRCAGFGEAEGF